MGASQPAVMAGDLRRRLFKAYAELLRRQRAASTALVRWSRRTSRAYDFAWLESGTEEKLMRNGSDLYIDQRSTPFPAVQRMYATARLNPHERDVLYGYPYVIGRQAGKSIRAPLLTLAVTIEPRGDSFVVRPADDVARFNTLPFRADEEAPAHEQAISRVIEATPSFLCPIRLWELSSIRSAASSHLSSGAHFLTAG